MVFRVVFRTTSQGESKVATTTEQAVHGQSARAPLSAIASYLQDVLGQRLTAVVAGVSDAKAVGKWARGGRVPHPRTALRLRHAYQVVQLLIEVESAGTIRAWFVGMNPELEDEAPAIVLGKDPARVLQAARTFLAHG
jgi:hypothetical protein